MSYLVTGASSGIGAAVTRLLWQQGNNLITCCRTAIPVRLSPHQVWRHICCDLSDNRAIQDQLGPILNDDLAGCIFCHGYGDFASLEQFSQKRIEKLIQTNLTSHIYLARKVIPVLKKRGKGDMVFIGSEAALQGAKYGTVYCAAKFGLRGFVQALRAECASAGVRVALINPGMVKTPFFDTLDFSPGENRANYLTAEDVAQSVQLILNTPMGSVVEQINLSPQKFVVQHK